MQVTTRFAPSPTGYLHIGGLRTALFNYLWAKKNGGKFLLRIEDTDLSRNSKEATDAILEAFDWTDLAYDEEAYYQSHRFDIYKKYIDILLDKNRAYKCYMTKDELAELRALQEARGERPRYDRRYRDFDGIPPDAIEPVIRIKAPLDRGVEFIDGIKGNVRFEADQLDDFIIARSDGTPTYNFVVAIDDYLMGLSDVIRGDDHLSNTPKQLIVYNALGFKPPKFYHIPLIHNEKGKKLSKRDGATDVMEYKKMGYLPEALINFLVRLGWSHKDQEIFSIDELINLFDPKDINKSASAYNKEKLDWLNMQYIKNYDNTKLKELLIEYGAKFEGVMNETLLLDISKDKAKTLLDIAKNINLISSRPAQYNQKDIKKFINSDSLDMLHDFHNIINSKNLKTSDEFEAFSKEFLETKSLKMPQLFKPLRIALLGVSSSPSVYDVMAILGVDEIDSRFEIFFKNYDK